MTHGPTPSDKWLKKEPKKDPCEGCAKLKCWCNTHPKWCAKCGNIAKPRVQVNPVINGMRFEGIHRTCGHVIKLPKRIAFFRYPDEAWDSPNPPKCQTYSKELPAEEFLCGSEDIFTAAQYLNGEEDAAFTEAAQHRAAMVDLSYPDDNGF